METKLKEKIYYSDCQFCGKEISGRMDKKFCNDVCRIEYHNKNNRDVSKFMSRINSILRKNRRILASLNPDGKAKVTRAQLLDEGFKFSYHTNHFKTKNGKVYYFCYEQGYLEVETNVYTLVVKHEYIE